MTLTTAKDAFIQYIYYGSEVDLKMALTICKSLKVPDEFLASLEATVKQSRTERLERIQAWEALPIEERRAIMEMSRT